MTEARRPLPAPPGTDPALLTRLREDLAEAEFTADAVAAILGEEASAALDDELALPAIRALTAAHEDEAQPLAALVLAFMLGQEVSPEALGRAVPRVGIEGLVALGLVRSTGADGDRVRATVDLRPYESTDDEGSFRWWIASDQGQAATGAALHPDHVLGIGGATSTLIAITPRTRVDSALDLGCGCGIQALHAARHASRVVATDVSERALAFTRFNAALNAPTLPAGARIETRLGSMLEPVQTERFDLIVSNPPFVITPRVAGAETWTYRDGGAVGDDLVGALIGGVHEHLSEGGLAVMLANWEVTGEEWPAHVDRWLATSPASAIVIERMSESPARYASTWLRDGGVEPLDPRWEPMMGAWLDDFSSRGVNAIGFGHVLIQQPSAPTSHFRVREHIETTGAGPLGPRYAEMLSVLARLAHTSDEDLRRSRLARADDVVERRHFVPGSEDPMHIDVVQGGGFGRTLPVSTHTAAILGVLDGQYPLQILLEAYASLLEAAGQGWEEAEADVLASLRTLLTWGFVRFAGD
ncbi:MAG: class I SAM-dependent methyltransferase [Dermabacter sp.]|nr:class I SAM-dependent methyltransferase [Dermabacter sp.]